MTDMTKGGQTHTSDISFHLATSDKELIDKVSSFLKRSGHLTFSDSMGLEHYIIDGRDGVTALSRNIDSAADKMNFKNKAKYGRKREHVEYAVDKALRFSQIPSHLKGYRYIRQILIRLMYDDSLITPISKTIYPDLYKTYDCRAAQIDRDIRYALGKTQVLKPARGPKNYICRLFEIAEANFTENEIHNR